MSYIEVPAVHGGFQLKSKRMKSIKEKAEEYSRCIASSEYTKEDFVSGANYVLEQIESIMKNVSDEYPRFQQGTIIHGRLIKLLEQLKK